MNNKKLYFVITPSYSDPNRYLDVRKNAENYYGSKDYAPYSGKNASLDIINDFVKDYATDSANADMLLTGLTILTISRVNSIYFAKDWKDDDVCKFCHLMAFKHGLEIVYEPK